MGHLFKESLRGPLEELGLASDLLGIVWLEGWYWAATTLLRVAVALLRLSKRQLGSKLLYLNL